MKSEHYIFFSTQIKDDIIILNKEECKHAYSVLRYNKATPIKITDGKGHFYECKFIQNTPEGAIFSIINIIKVPAPNKNINVFIGLNEKEPFAETCEILSSIGVNFIYPVICEYCQNPWWKSWEKHYLRIQKKMISGIKQAKNPWLPILLKPLKFDEALLSLKENFILVAEEKGNSVFKIWDNIKDEKNISCFVGPPGGFSSKEKNILTSYSSFFISLSPNRLRTEIASVVLIGLISALSI